MKKPIFILTTIVFLMILTGWWVFGIPADPVDDCLDAGGSWHYDIEECSFTENYRGSRPE